MKRRLFRNFPLVALFAVAALLAAAGTAGATGPVGGGFESGTLAGWAAHSFYENTEWTALPKADAETRFETTLPAAVGPYVGATEYGGADTAILSQTFELPSASQLELSLYLFYKSEAAMSVPVPDTLFVKDEEPGGNQQVRVDVLKPNAPLESLSPNDILATLYASPPGGPQVLGPTLLSADLSQFAGQTVTLRIANAVSDGQMEVGVGGVSLVTTPIPPPPPPAPAVAEEKPTSPVSDGVASPVARKLVHYLVTGGGQLAVRLPTAGTLTVSDARRKVAVGSAFSTVRRRATNPKPILIRTAGARTAGPQTVHVTLRPTPAARRLLAKNGRVPFRLQLTFTSAAGAVSTSTFDGALVKRLGPTRR